MFIFLLACYVYGAVQTLKSTNPSLNGVNLVLMDDHCEAEHMS